MASSGSATATLNSSKDPLSSQLLSSSVSSLSNSTSSRNASSQISKIYRQASTLFLTRRLPEALSTILPVITPPTSDENGGSDNQPAPVATASRSTRIKVWSLYLTILNAILELEPDEGKEVFGSQEWRNLVTIVRDGEVWEEVVKNGYHGIEGDVDADVIINLSTILLSHARNQTLNQQRLENYLASSHNPTLDISARLSSLGSPRRISPSKSKSHGTDTPRDLITRIRILELFTLHVLRQNNEWDYAHSFISSSPDLDDERREAFLLALQQIHDEDIAAQRSNQEEQRRKEEQLQREMEEAKRRRLENEEREREKERRDRERRQEGGSELDYGVESSSSRQTNTIKTKPPKQTPIRHSASPSPASSSTQPKPRPKSKALPSPTYSQKIITIISNLRRVLGNISNSLINDPMKLLRMLVFVVGMLTVLGRRDVRERVRRVLGRGWGRVVETAGMGVKVSYL